jgi:hypothetical protein
MHLFRKLSFRHLLWALFLGLSCGCQKKASEGSHTYLIPWPNAAGQYKLREVTLHTLNSPYVMDGAAAQVYSEQGFRNDELAGRPAQVRLSEVDGVYIPQDAPSALAVTVYAHFEALKEMEERQHLPTQMDWPRKVGVGVPVRLEDGRMERNNARYFSVQDLIGITPYEGRGLDLAFNAGVLAHEHFHAVFQRLFLSKVSDGSPEPSVFEDKVTVEDNRSDSYYSTQFVLRAWNEGLADFFAYAYTRDPDFMGDSMSLETRGSRRLDGPIGLFQSPKQLAANIRLLSKNKQCPYGFCLAYNEGTKLSRLLYEVWQKLPSAERRDFLVEILEGLREAAQPMTLKMQAQGLGLKDLLPHIVSAERVEQTSSCKSLILLLGLDKTLLESYQNCRVLPAAPVGEEDASLPEGR